MAFSFRGIAGLKADQVAEKADELLDAIIGSAPDWPGWKYIIEDEGWGDEPFPYYCDTEDLPVGWVRIRIDMGYPLPFDEVMPLLSGIQFPADWGYKRRLASLAEHLDKAIDARERNQ